MMAPLRSFFTTRWYAGLALVFLACLAFLAADLRNHRFALVDFEVFYRAGERILRGETLYQPAVDGFYEYKYGPSAAFLFVPFTLLPLGAAKVIWWLLLSAVVTANLWLCVLLARPDYRSEPPARVNAVVLLSAATVAVHFMLELHLGQVNQLLLLLFLLAALAFTGGNPAGFGLTVAVSLFVKPFALIFAPYLVLRRRWADLAWAAGAAAALGLAPRLCYGATAFADQYRGWGQRIAEEMAKKTELLAPGNHTLFSIAARYTPLRLLAGDPAGVLAIRVGLLAALAAGMLWMVRRGRAVARPEAAEFAALLTVIPLLAFTSYNAFGSTMLAAVVILFHFRELGPFRAPAVAGLILVGGNVYDLWGKARFQLFDRLSLVAVGAVLLLATLWKGRSARVM